MKTLGLIAGCGNFPLLLAQSARAKNMRVVAACVKNDTSFGIRFLVDRCRFFHAGQLKQLFSFFKSEGVTEVIMAGQVNPDNLFNQKVALDEEFQELFKALKDRKADTIFSAVAERLKKEGVELLDSTLFLRNFLAPAGTLTHRGPTLTELADIEFGQSIAKAMGGLDVGQTVVVKEKAIVAIEAMEGTDQMILRGGRIAHRGAVVVKMSKPNQDFRFDIPVVGPRTVTFMKKARASCLAIEAGKTLIIDRKSFIKSANQFGICIVAALKKPESNLLRPV